MKDQPMNMDEALAAAMEVARGLHPNLHATVIPALVLFQGLKEVSEAINRLVEVAE